MFYSCHRPDPHTPIEETVWAMSDIVASGKAHYWGTSEWPAEQVRAAWEIADSCKLRKPSVEQPEYNLFKRARVEGEYAALHRDIGLGIATWSPLASGLLTGKYRRRRPGEEQSIAVELRVAARLARRRRAESQGSRARNDCPGAARHDSAVGDRVVHQEPLCRVGDPRGEWSPPTSGEPGRAGRCAATLG